MAMFSNDVRVVNTATPAFLTEPNVTQYGWTKSEAAHYNQLIQYVDEARQIYEYISEKVIYFDAVLGKLEGIENVIDFMVQKANEVAEDAREVRTAASYVTGVNTQIEIMYRNFNADYSNFNYKFADFTIQYADVLEKAYATQLNSEKAEKAYQDTKDLYDDLKAGQVYRGTWNPEQTAAYPDGSGTNSTWDVVLDFGTPSFDAQGKTWRSGDRLIYALDLNTYYQINTGSGVDSVNGLTGSVTLNAIDVGAVALAGNSTMTGPLFFNDKNKYVSFATDDTYIAAKAGKVYIEGLDDPVVRVKGSDHKMYHQGFKPSAADVNAVGLTGHQIMSDSLTARQFKATFSKGFVSSLREDQGMFMDTTEPNRRTILAGGGSKTEQVGAVHIRPNGFTSNLGETVFTAFGQISNPVDPVSDAHLTNKKYVDGKVNAEVGDGLLMRVGGARDKEIDVALAGATGGAFVSETKPDNPFQGARWFDTNEGRTFIWFDDGDSAQWVEENPQNADVVSNSARLVKLADDGILDVALGKKGAITVNNDSSISMQDSGATVFHNFANGNGLEWSHGNLAENTLMTLDAGANLHTKGPIFSVEGHVVESKDQKTWVSMEAIDGADPYIATKSLGETSVRKTIEFLPSKVRFGKEIFTNRAHITDDGGLIFSPAEGRAGVTWGVGIHPTLRSFAAHRYVDGVWQGSPLEFSSAGAPTFNSTVFVNGSIGVNQGYVQINRTDNPMLELHSPGITAGMMYLPGPGRMRFSQSNGAGGEAAPYAELQPQFAHFFGSVRPDVRSASWGQWGSAIGGIQDNTGNRIINPGQWHPMITSAAYVDGTYGYSGRWAIGYYRPAAQHNGEVVINMNGDGSLRNNLRFVFSGAGGGNFRMDGSDTGQTWGLQEGGFLYGSSFGVYGHMVGWCEGSFAPKSDARLKKNIQPSTKSALENVAKIKFHSFDWIDDKTKSSDLGLIAQELEEINPSYAKDIETFNPDGSVNTSFKSLDTANLLALALKSIQELQAEIEELKEKVNG